jgi:tetratricopeptide (TPR) repeat protein
VQRRRQETIHVKKTILKLAVIAAALIINTAALAQEGEEEFVPREHDEIHVKDGIEPLIGTITRETESDVYIELLGYGGGLETKVPKSVIEKLLRRTTPLMAFNAKRGKVGVGDFGACFELALWAQQYPELREKMKEALRDSIKINPKFLDAYLLLSDLIQEEYRKLIQPTEEQLNAEIALYRHAINSGMQDPRIYYHMGLVLRKVGLRELAVTYLKRAIEANESAAVPEITRWSYQEIGEMMLALGKPEEALRQFEAVLADAPEDFRSLLGQGEALLMIGDLDKAAPVLAHAATVDALYSKSFLLLGSISYLRGEDSDAEVWLNRALEVGLPDPQVLTTIGLLHARMGKFKSSGEELGRALSLDPEYWQAEAARGYLAENQGNAQDAITAYESALRINPSSGYVHFKLGGAFVTAGDKESAAGEYYAALENGYKPVEVFKALGRMEFEAGNWEASARYFRYSVAADDNDTGAHYLLAMSYLRQEDHNNFAERHFDKVISLDPAHAGALSGLGYLAYQSGDIAVAKNYFGRAGASGDAGAYAQEALNRIEQVLRWDRWEDAFRRPDSEELLRGWNEENEGSSGIMIQIKDNTARFSGKQRDSEKQVFLSRKESGREFVRMEAVLNGIQAAGARYGIKIEKRGSKNEIQGSVVFIRDMAMSLAYSYTESKGKWANDGAPVELQEFPLDTKSHSFAIGLSYDTGDVELIFDGRKVAQVKCPPLARTRSLEVGVFGVADTGVEWTLVLETVRIYRLKSGGK